MSSILANGIVLAVVAAAMILAGRSLWKSHKRGGCSGNCSGCAGCASCHPPRDPKAQS